MKNKTLNTRKARHFLYALLCVVTFSCATLNNENIDYVVKNDTIIIMKTGYYEFESITDSTYRIQRVE